MNEKVKVFKGLITKEIQKKDLPQYVAMGWQEYKGYSTPMFTKVK